MVSRNLGRNKKDERLYISNNFFIINEINQRFLNEDELLNIIYSFFMNSCYKIITIYRKVTNKNGYYSILREYVIEDLIGNKNLEIVCDKEYLGTLKFALINMGFDICEPKVLKNKR